MRLVYKKSILFIISILASFSVNAQCTWQTVVSDGFEYTGVCPDLVPGKTVHNVPQSFAVHSGNLSLYMNFVTCNGTTGACAGDKIYERKFFACPFQRYRFSAWLTTSFSGLMCNVRIKITDKLGNVLDDQLQIPAPYAPAWVQYQSPDVIPQSDTLIFTLYTNVGGGQNGNDLSFDDFLLEECLAPYGSTSAQTVCANQSPVDLFSYVPYQNSTVGTWSGPSSLSGGHLGTFDPNTHLAGTYIYNNYPFSNNCPVSDDSVQVALVIPPAPELGNDTTLCTTQSLILNPGTGTGYTYLWSNGVTGPQVVAFAPGGNPAVTTYSVLVTDSSGCQAADSVTISFVTCTGINEAPSDGTLTMHPNPTNGSVYMTAPAGTSMVTITDLNGKMVMQKEVRGGEQKIDVSMLASGIYTVRLLNGNGSGLTGNLIVR